MKKTARMLTEQAAERAGAGLLLRPICLVLVGLAGCATTGEDRAAQSVAPNDPGVTVIPWNTPERWEQQGMLGGYADYFDRR